MNMHQYENDIIRNIIFNNFKERIISRLFNRYNIYISNDEFKRIEGRSIEEANRSYAKAVYVAAAKKTKAITKAKSIEKVKKTKANAMANAKANAMAMAMAMAMVNAKAMANARR